MPVPGVTNTYTERRLLRDLVHDKLQSAIEDGTLEAGERLLDDELIRWFGVSRTPIREAMSRLRADGLIEMEANRYTKVTAYSVDEYRHASTFLAGLHRLALQGSLAGDGNDTRISEAAAAIEPLDATRSLAELRCMLDLYGDLAAATNNPLFVATEASVRARVKHHAKNPAAPIDWTAAEAARGAISN